MMLKTYLTEKNLSAEAFAKLVPVSVGGVKKWLSGERIPRSKFIHRIEQITGGDVTVADFFTPRSAPPSSGATA